MKTLSPVQDLLPKKDTKQNQNNTDSKAIEENVTEFANVANSLCERVALIH